MNRTVAVKLLHTDLDTVSRERFFREGRAVGGLSVDDALGAHDRHRGPMIGLTRAAFEHVVDTVWRGKSIGYSSYARSVDTPSHQLALADAAALLDTAVLHARCCAGAVDAAARAGVQLDGLVRARVRSDLAPSQCAAGR
jgi:hypothetical protein